MNAPPTLSVVLPSYRGAAVARANVPLLMAYLRGSGVTHEVIIVDDGSDDGGETERVAGELGCRYEANPVNRGKGAAVRRGMLAACGRVRLYTDIDVPYELESIDRALYYLVFKEFHMVAGDRTLEDSSYYKKVSVARHVASEVFSAFVGRIVAGGWYDTQCGFKGFRDHVTEDLFSVSQVDRFAFDVELFYVALKRNYDIKRIPVNLRSNETSSVRVSRDGPAMVRDLAVIRFNQLRGAYAAKVPVRRIERQPDPVVQWRSRWPPPMGQSGEGS